MGFFDAPDPPTPPSAPPPPPDLAESIVRQNDAQMKRKLRSQMGLSKFFQPPSQSTTAPPPPPANMGSKTLLGQ